MKTRTEPESYLSNTGASWTVIVQGGAVCASTTEERARSVATRFKIQTARIWDGSAGVFVDAKGTP